MVTYGEDDADLVFHALAHRARRQILDILKSHPGSRVVDVSDRFGISRIAILKHLGVLSEAHLVISRKEGRERRLYLNPVPIQRVHERWTDEYGALFASGALELKRRVESKEPSSGATPYRVPEVVGSSANEPERRSRRGDVKEGADV